MTDAIDPISYNAGIEAVELICPFCGHDPFHYVDNGVGMEAVAVTCCELGDQLFRGMRPAPETVTLGWEEFCEIAGKLRALHRTEPQTAPDTSEVPTRYKPGDIVVRDGIVRRFIEAEIEGEKWEILGTLAPYVHPDHAAPAADAERLALDDGALLNRLKTEAQLAKNGGHPILERSFNLAIDEIKKLREAAKGQLVVVNVAIAERQRAERNRDMWKGQCERQAEELTALRAGGWREDMQS